MAAVKLLANSGYTAWRRGRLIEGHSMNARHLIPILMIAATICVPDASAANPAAPLLPRGFLGRWCPQRGAAPTRDGWDHLVRVAQSNGEEECIELKLDMRPTVAVWLETQIEMGCEARQISRISSEAFDVLFRCVSGEGRGSAWLERISLRLDPASDTLALKWHKRHGR
jgi:hypothetical protein